MPATAQTLDYTREEYLALDEAAPEGRRWEYDGARVYLMAGASPEHNQLSHNISRHVGNALVPRGCRVMQSDQRVQLGRGYVYPDVVAFCKDGRFTDERPPTLLNPGLVVEVLSGSTMERDLTWKLQAYRSIESVREVWMIWTDVMRLDQYMRVGDSSKDGSSNSGRSNNGSEWRLRSLESKGDTLRSETFDLEIPVAELYELVL